VREGYSRASSAASSIPSSNGQDNPRACARLTYLLTAPFDHPTARAIFVWLSFASNFSRRTPVILRIGLLLLGMLCSGLRKNRTDAEKIEEIQRAAIDSEERDQRFRQPDHPFRQNTGNRIMPGGSGISPSPTTGWA
jgi:hypothetical protein